MHFIFKVSNSPYNHDGVAPKKCFCEGYDAHTGMWVGGINIQAWACHSFYCLTSKGWKEERTWHCLPRFKCKQAYAPNGTYWKFKVIWNKIYALSFCQIFRSASEQKTTIYSDVLYLHWCIPPLMYCTFFWSFLMVAQPVFLCQVSNPFDFQPFLSRSLDLFPARLTS